MQSGTINGRGSGSWISCRPLAHFSQCGLVWWLRSNVWFLSSFCQDWEKNWGIDTTVHVYTTIEQIFVPGYLSRLPLDPGQKVVFVSGPTASRASGGDRGLLSRLEASTGTKVPFFVSVDGSTRDKRPNPFVPVGSTNPD